MIENAQKKIDHKNLEKIHFEVHDWIKIDKKNPSLSQLEVV